MLLDVFFGFADVLVQCCALPLRFHSCPWIRTMCPSWLLLGCRACLILSCRNVSAQTASCFSAVRHSSPASYILLQTDASALDQCFKKCPAGTQRTPGSTRCVRPDFCSRRKHTSDPCLRLQSVLNLKNCFSATSVCSDASQASLVFQGPSNASAKLPVSCSSEVRHSLDQFRSLSIMRN